MSSNVPQPILHSTSLNLIMLYMCMFFVDVFTVYYNIMFFKKVRWSNKGINIQRCCSKYKFSYRLLTKNWQCIFSRTLQNFIRKKYIHNEFYGCDLRQPQTFSIFDFQIVFCIVVIFERKNSIRSSGFLFNFWFVLFLVSIVTFRSKIRVAVLQVCIIHSTRLQDFN